MAWKARLERQKRDIALNHAAETISDESYMERLARIRADLAALDSTTRPGLSAERTVEWLQAIGATWRKAEIRQEKADLLHAIYERIVVEGPRIVSARLTPAAYAHGLALALPEEVAKGPDRSRADTSQNPGIDVVMPRRAGPRWVMRSA